MNFDLTMPVVLLLVSFVATLLNRKVESKLKGVFEEREFRIRDAVMLVASISVTVLVIVWIPQFALMAIFLFAYSMILFIFSYLFSDFSKGKASLFCLTFLTASLVAGMTIQFNYVSNDLGVYGFLTFYGLAGFALGSLIYEQVKIAKKERWYLAVLPPALFICLYVFYGKTIIWFPYLMNLYGTVFAVLIILYIGSLFTWKTTLVFVGLLTIADIVLVLVTKSMVSAATSASDLRLPVLISLPITPLMATEKGLQYMSLGLGDFFFAGLLATQTWRKFGKRSAIASIVAMGLSFFVFEAALLTYGPTAFPGTVMIICGWLPLILWKKLERQHNREAYEEKKPVETESKVLLTK